MNRCLAFNSKNKRCRAKTKTGDLFCCEKHKPINKEIITDGCFICMDKIIESNDILYFKCNHAFHKSCYLEWLKFSTYEEPICIICRKVSFPKKIDEKKISKIKVFSDTEKLNEINNIINNHIVNYYTLFPSYESISPLGSPLNLSFCKEKTYSLS